MSADSWQSRNEFDNDEFDDDVDYDPDGDKPALVPCSSCGAQIYDDSVTCPKCGDYVVADTNPWSGHSVAWIVLGALGVLATVAVLALG